MAGNFTSFGDPIVDFSWVLKLSDDDKIEGPDPSTFPKTQGDNQSASSSPNRDSPESSGYWSFPEEPASIENSRQSTPDSDEYPSLVPSMHSLSLSAPGTIPIWSPLQPTVIGRRSMHQFINSGLQYQLHPPELSMKTNEENYFYLMPRSGTTPPSPGLPMSVCTKVLHSSGFESIVEMQKIDILPGYRCSFFPIFAGRYSARVYQSGQEQYLDGAGGNLGTKLEAVGVCAPLEMMVSRNYLQEASDVNSPKFNLEPNGDKYWGISVDNFTDRLFVTDRHASEVIIIDPATNTPIRKFGQNSSNPMLKLYRPTGLVVDRMNKRLIISDKDNHRITFFTLDGQYVSSFGKRGHGQAEFNYPWDVDVNPSGDQIVVSDSRNHRIQLFDRFGNYLRKFTVFESDPFEYKQSFDYPRGITFDNEGKNIYTTDFNTNNVLSLDLQSWEYKLLVPPGKMMRPQGITVDEMGNILVCDSRRSCLRVMTSGGDLIATVDKIGKQPLSVPVDVCMLRGNQVAVVDICGKVRIF